MPSEMPALYITDAAHGQPWWVREINDLVEQYQGKTVIIPAQQGREPGCVEGHCKSLDEEHGRHLLPG